MIWPHSCIINSDHKWLIYSRAQWDLLQSGRVLKSKTTNSLQFPPNHVGKVLHLKLISMKSLEFSCLNTQNFSFFRNDCRTSTDDVYKRLKHNGICLKSCITVSPLDCLGASAHYTTAATMGKCWIQGAFTKVSIFHSVLATDFFLKHYCKPLVILLF